MSFESTAIFMLKVLCARFLWLYDADQLKLQYAKSNGPNSANRQLRTKHVLF